MNYNFKFITTGNKTVTENNASKNNDMECEIYIGLVVMLTITSVITTTINIILCWREMVCYINIVTL